MRRLSKRLIDLVNKLIIENGSSDLIESDDNNEEKIDFAETYWKLLAENGDLSVQSRLGHLYENQGKFDLAEQYYKLAAAQGDKKAQNNLVLLYHRQGKENLFWEAIDKK